MILKKVSGSVLFPSILYLLYAPPNAPSSNLGSGFEFSSAYRDSLLAIRNFLFLLFFALLIFLFRSAILDSMHLFPAGGCLWVIGTLDSLDSLALDSASLSAILSASRFMDLIFFLLNLALVLSDTLVILSFRESNLDFKLSISSFRLLAFLATLESLFLLCLSCLLVKGASNSVEQGTKSTPRVVPVHVLVPK